MYVWLVPSGADFMYKDDTYFLFCRDHDFDRPERAKTKRKLKFGYVAQPSAPSRGAQSVRQWHKKDESKILATKRLNIDTSGMGDLLA